MKRGILLLILLLFSLFAHDGFSLGNVTFDNTSNFNLTDYENYTANESNYTDNNSTLEYDFEYELVENETTEDNTTIDYEFDFGEDNETETDENTTIDYEFDENFTEDDLFSLLDEEIIMFSGGVVEWLSVSPKEYGLRPVVHIRALEEVNGTVTWIVNSVEHSFSLSGTGVLMHEYPYDLEGAESLFVRFEVDDEVFNWTQIIWDDKSVSSSINDIYCIRDACYFAQDNGWLTKINITTGNAVWNRQMPGSAPHNNNRRIRCDTDHCFFLSGNSFYKITHNNNLAWGSGITPNANLAWGLDCFDNHCYLGYPLNVYKVAKSDGSVLGFGNPGNENIHRGISCQDDFCFSAKDSGEITKWNASSGVAVWSVNYNSGNAGEDIFCIDNRCVVSQRNGYVVEISQSDGASAWSAQYGSGEHGNRVWCDSDFCFVSHNAGRISKISRAGSLVQQLRPSTTNAIGLVCSDNHCYSGHGTTWTKFFDSQSITYPAFGCGEITESGDYLVINDLDSEGVCLTILASDVIIRSESATVSSIQSFATNTRIEGLKSESIELFKGGIITDSEIDNLKVNGTVTIKDNKIGELIVDNVQNSLFEENTIRNVLLEEKIQTNTVFTRNTFEHNDTHLYYIATEPGNSVYFYQNDFIGTGEYVFSIGPGLYLNRTVNGYNRGNYYTGLEALNLNDSTKDGFADTGSNYPLNSMNWGEKFIGEAKDESPWLKYREVTGCMDLDVPNVVYVQMNDIIVSNTTSGSCFKVNADNIIFRGNNEYQVIKNQIGLFAHFSNNILGYWPFFGNANDYSGNENHGIISGATITTNRNGDMGQAYAFNGINNYIRVNNNFIEDAPTSLTTSVWFKPEISTNDFRCVLHKNTETTIGTSQYWSGINSDNFLTATIGARDGVGWNAGQTNIMPSYGEWHHLVASWDGSVVKVYVNGVYNTQYNLNYMSELDAITRFGSSSDGAHYQYKGSIDEIVIFNKSLNEQEIDLLYNFMLHGFEDIFSIKNRENIVFENVNYSSKGNFVTAKDSKNIQFENLYSQNTFIDSDYEHFLFENVENVEFKNNYFSSERSVIRADSNIDGLVVFNNTFFSENDERYLGKILIEKNSKNVSVINNSILGDGGLIHVESGSNIVEFSNNTFNGKEIRLHKDSSINLIGDDFAQLILINASNSVLDNVSFHTLHLIDSSYSNITNSNLERLRLYTSDEINVNNIFINNTLYSFHNYTPVIISDVLGINLINSNIINSIPDQRGSLISVSDSIITFRNNTFFLNGASFHTGFIMSFFNVPAVQSLIYNNIFHLEGSNGRYAFVESDTNVPVFTFDSVGNYYHNLEGLEDTTGDGVGNTGPSYPVSSSTIPHRWIGPGFDSAPLSNLLVTNIGCDYLTDSNIVYDISYDVLSSSSCFFILGDNVVFRGNGFSITGPLRNEYFSDSKVVGITVLGTNVTISNFIMSNYHIGIFANNSNIVIEDVSFINMSGGISSQGFNARSIELHNSVSGLNNLNFTNSKQGIGILSRGVQDIYIQNSSVTLSNLNFNNFISSQKTCPEGYILVEGSNYFETEDFCVMKYEAKAWSSLLNDYVPTGCKDNVDCLDWDNYSLDLIKPKSVPNNLPMRHLTLDQANTVCSNLGEGYAIIDNNQYMTIARQIESNSMNWHMSQYLYRGHTDGNPTELLEAHYDDNESYYGIDHSSTLRPWLKRTHILNNGEIIWDFSGNSKTFVSLNNVDSLLGIMQNRSLCSSGEGSFEYSGIGSCDLSLPLYNSNYDSLVWDVSLELGPSSNLNSFQRIGRIISTQGHNYLSRGGSFNQGDSAGIYAVTSENKSMQTGFRCTLKPNHNIATINHNIYSKNSSVNVTSSNFKSYYFYSSNVSLNEGEGNNLEFENSIISVYNYNIYSAKVIASNVTFSNVLFNNAEVLSGFINVYDYSTFNFLDLASRLINGISFNFKSVFQTIQGLIQNNLFESELVYRYKITSGGETYFEDRMIGTSKEVLSNAYLKLVPEHTRVILEFFDFDYLNYPMLKYEKDNETFYAKTEEISFPNTSYYENYLNNIVYHNLFDNVNPRIGPVFDESNLSNCKGVFGEGACGSASLNNDLSIGYDNNYTLSLWFNNKNFDFIQLSANAGYTCGILKNGFAMCWGVNQFGRLGDGTLDDKSIPNQIAGNYTFKSIHTGTHHSCGLLVNNSVMCWGYGGWGVLGRNSPAGSYLPVLVHGNYEFKVISGGHRHNCGIITNGTALCWGAGYSGQLGNNNTANMMVPTPISGNYEFIDISSGEDHSCGILVNGSAMCWGLGSYHRLGNSNEENSLIPVFVENNYEFKSISAGYTHTCGLLINGSAMCWGRGSAGQLGNGYVTKSMPIFVSGNHIFESISSGNSHTCGLLTNSSMMCWGTNANGALGHGVESVGSSPVPVFVSGGYQFKHLSDINLHACGITKDSSTICWGLGTSGQLGQGIDTDNKYIPTEIKKGYEIIEYSEGSSHSCVLTSAGNVFCLGLGLSGRLGTGNEMSATTASLVLGNYSFKQIDSEGAKSYGRAFNCGVLVNGSGMCWGDNYLRYLGDGTNNNRHSPVFVQGNLEFQKIKTSNLYHACGLLTNGSIYCWGYNNLGQTGGLELYVSTPTIVAGNYQYKDLALDAGYSYAININGSPMYWGGSVSSSPIFLDSDIHNFNKLFTSSGYRCGILDNKSAVCWGTNAEGRLGVGDLNFKSTPTLVQGNYLFDELYLGTTGTCGKLSNKSFACWGTIGNLTSQLTPQIIYSNEDRAISNIGLGIKNELCIITKKGDALCENFKQNSNSMTNVRTKIMNYYFTDISTYAANTCGILENGSTLCWGHRMYGQIGDGVSSPTYYYEPKPVITDYLFKDVSSGPTHTCAINFDNEIICWGQGSHGAVGIGTGGHTYTPAKIDTENKFIQVGAGLYFSCGLLINGSAMCWGYNLHGQVGDGTNINTNSPVFVNTSEIFKQLSVGYHSVCGITIKDKTFCWGYNNAGQIGDGTNINKNVPVEIQGAYEFKKISKGIYSSCGILKNGSAMCWGYNIYGEMGDGTTINRNVPVLVQTNYLFKDIQISYHYTCGILENDSVACWGYNHHGQLGTGDKENKLTPTLTQINEKFKKITTGSAYTCGITTNNETMCWGYNRLNNDLIIGKQNTISLITSRTIQDKTNTYSISIGHEYASASIGDISFEPIKISSGWNHLALSNSIGGEDLFSANGVVTKGVINQDRTYFGGISFDDIHVDELLVLNRSLDYSELEDLYLAGVYSVEFSVPPNTSGVIPVFDGHDGSFRVRSVQRPIGDFYASINTDNFFLGNWFSARDSLFLNVSRPSPVVSITVLNDSIETYSNVHGFNYLKNVTFDVSGGFIFNPTFAVRQISATTEMIESFDRLTSCNSVLGSCSVMFNVSINTGLSAPATSTFELEVNYTDANGVRRTRIVDFYITIQQYRLIVFNQSVVFDDVNIQDGLSIPLRLTNIGSSGTGTINIDTPDHLDVFFEGSYESSIFSVGAGQSIDVEIHLSLTDLSDRVFDSNITFEYTNVVTKLPVRVIVNQSLSPNGIEFVQEHNTSKDYIVEFVNDGNVVLQNVNLQYLPNSLPGEWVSFASSLSSSLVSGASRNHAIYVSVPEFTPPGNYSGVIRAMGSHSFVQDIPFNIVVPVNQTWSISEDRISFNQLISMDSQNKPLPPFNITNQGNVPLNFSVTYTTGGLGFPALPETRYNNPGIEALTHKPFFVVEPGTTRSYDVLTQSYADADGIPENMRLAFNYTLLNPVSTNRLSSLVDYLITIMDADPLLDSWRNYDHQIISNQSGIEYNKPFVIQARIFDDGGNLNESAAYFTIFDGVETHVFEPSEIYNVSPTLHRYYLNFTPSTFQDHIITVFAEEKNASEKNMNASITLRIAVRPNQVFFDTSAIDDKVSASVNSTHNVTLTVPFRFSVLGGRTDDGRVTAQQTNIYNLSLFFNDGTSRNFSSFINPGFETSLNLTVEAGILPGNYTRNISASYIQPDGTPVILNHPLTLEVLPNYDLFFNVPDPIIVLHNQTNLIPVNITSVGNAIGDYVLSASNNLYPVDFAGGGYHNPSTPFGVNPGQTIQRNMRIQVPAFASNEDTFLLSVQTPTHVVSMNASVFVVLEPNLGVAPLNITENVVAGETYNISYFSVYNFGNYEGEINISIDNFGFPIGHLPSISVLPGEVKPVRFWFTAPLTEDVFNGTVNISFGNESIIIPMSLTLNQVELGIFNISGPEEVVPNDFISFIVQLWDSGNAVDSGIQSMPLIDNEPCSNAQGTSVIHNGEPAVRFTCRAPSALDGVSHSFSVSVLYNSPFMGEIFLTREDITQIYYKDTTPPRVTSFIYNDVEAYQPYTFIARIADNTYADNLPIDYRVRLMTTHTYSGQTFISEPFVYNGVYDHFSRSLQFEIPGEYEFIVSVTDPSGNVNSSFTGSFTVYENRLYESLIQYRDFSNNLVGSNFTIELIGNSFQETDVVNGELHKIIPTGVYDMFVKTAFMSLKIPEINLLNIPSDKLVYFAPLSPTRRLVSAQQLEPTVNSNKVYDGFLVKVEHTGLFSVRYDYQNLVDLGSVNRQAMRAFICPDYNIDVDALFACASWSEMSIVPSETSSEFNYVTFSSTRQIQESKPAAIIFFEHPREGYPQIQINPSELFVAGNHNSTVVQQLDLQALPTSSPLEGITLNCEGALCNLISVPEVSTSTLSPGASRIVDVMFMIPHNTNPGRHLGSIIYRSNSNRLVREVPVTFDVLGTPSFNVEAPDVRNIETATQTPTKLGVFGLTSTGNVDVTLSINSSLPLISESEIIIPRGQKIYYVPEVMSSQLLGNDSVTLNIGDLEYEFNLSNVRRLQLVSVIPQNDIVANESLFVEFKLFNEFNEEVREAQQYFIGLSARIDGFNCFIPQETIQIDYVLSDSFICYAPNIDYESDSHEFTLQLNHQGVTAQARTSLGYKDVIPPRIETVERNVNFNSLSGVSLSLFDRNNISMVHVASPTQGVDFRYSVDGSFTTLSRINNSFVFNHTFSSEDDIPLNFYFCDFMNNCDNETVYLSHYPDVQFSSEVTRGHGSSPVSSIVRHQANPISSQVFFKRPSSNDILYEIPLKITDGKLLTEVLQRRNYDIQIVSDGMTLNLRDVEYNGSPIVSFEKITEFRDVNQLRGYQFIANTSVNGNLTFFAPKTHSLSSFYFVKCSEWEVDVCSGTEIEMWPKLALNYNATHYSFAVDVDSFSAYILSVPPISVPALPDEGGDGSSPGAGGGGGGGGGSSIPYEQLRELLDNVSKVVPSRTDIQADTSSIERVLEPGDKIFISITVANIANRTREVNIQVDEKLRSVVFVPNNRFELVSGGTREVLIELYAGPDLVETIFDGFIRISYDNEFFNIPVSIRIRDTSDLPQLSLTTLTPKITPSGALRAQLNLRYTYAPRVTPMSFRYEIHDVDRRLVIYSETEVLNVSETFSEVKVFDPDDSFMTGRYYLQVYSTFLDVNGQERTIMSAATFEVTELFLYIQLLVLFNFNVLLWHIFVLIGFVTIVVITYKQIRKYVESKKRYHLPVEKNLLPMSSKEAGFVGHLAETNHRVFMDFNDLKMHTLVAGSTGGGKSFSAQVIVEEALIHNKAVVVFDPTAQWSGFLRKQTSESLLKLYPKFGMDASKDPRAFKGNIRRVENPLEIIELSEYLKPGEITIFDCHKMNFEQIDKFVANTVSQVFLADLEEVQDMRLLMVYDEVHRLLPKFGGSGAGFMQVERACREFRKWGIGVLLISQVLSDFVGQIKANINTEVQMRTRDEEDLKRLSLKYGEELLRSVIKANIGTGMVQNSKYNRGRPYLVSFRPLLHAVERLTESELKQYDAYNENLLTLQDSVSQIAKFVDTMDVQIEIDLAYDKLKEGKFDVVNIYVEELERKLESMWIKQGKKPVPRKKKLLDEKEMERFIELAMKEHKKIKKEDLKEDNGESSDESDKKDAGSKKTSDDKANNESESDTGDKAGASSASKADAEDNVKDSAKSVKDDSIKKGPAVKGESPVVKESAGSNKLSKLKSLMDED